MLKDLTQVFPQRHSPSGCILINHMHIQSDIHSCWSVVLIEALLREPLQTIGNAESIPRSQIDFQASADLTRCRLKQIRFPVGYLLSCQKSCLETGCTELFTPDLHRRGREIYLPLSGCCHFWKSEYSTVQRRVNNGMLFGNGQWCS